MGRYLEENEDGLRSLPCSAASLTQLRAGGSAMAQRILALLAERARYSHEIAKELKVHEQKVYYHMRKLEHAGLIREERKEEISGASAKYFRLASQGFAVLFAEPQPSTAIRIEKAEHRRFLTPFIREGKPDFLIVVGSPDAHGPQMARGKDGSYAIDLALFLGSFLAEQPRPVMKLDTEFRKEDWQRNLIIIGGPIVNTVTERINKDLPIRFVAEGKKILSTITSTTYESDEIGVVEKITNPFSKGKSILFIAGRRKAGTKAAMLAFLRHFDELIAGNLKKRTVMARVVEGRDLDSDGVVDDVRFRE